MTDPQARLASALAGRYRIERELGQGGMATVYLAQDVKHERKVAIKVLRPELAAVIGAERFLREIKTIATLQHPHILGLIDSGELEGTAYYVMPFVEGESLRDRLTREKQLPVADAVRLATEVAGALDYAHRHGIIHRDIKPENVMLHDGAALVTDFGIALAVSKTGGTRMTETGMSLGTPHYMSPEQAMGEREITARSDVYALGAMTYEMLVGEPPFTGPTAQAIIAKVMTGEPASLTAQRKSVPPGVEAAVFTALEKLPADRFASAAEFAAALKDDTARPATGSRAAARPAGSPLALRALGVVAMCSTLAALALAVKVWRPAAPPVTRLGLDLPALRVNHVGYYGVAFALSPDGRRLAYVAANEPGPTRIAVRDLGDLQVRTLEGTDGGDGPFFSPDGKWVGYIADSKLYKVPVAGGAPVELAGGASSILPGGAWLADDRILYTSDAFGLRMVPAGGGAATEVLPAPADGVMAFPTRLPGRTRCSSRSAATTARRSTCWRSTWPRGPWTRWPGTLRGASTSAMDGWWYCSRTGPWPGRRSTSPSSASSGRRSPSSTGCSSRSAWCPRWPWPTTGRWCTCRPTRWRGWAPSAPWTWRGAPAWWTPPGGPASRAWPSPGRALTVVSTAEPTGNILWVKQLDQGPLTRLSFDGSINYRPAWLPDGRAISFSSDRDRSRTYLYRLRADGSDQPARLLPGDTAQVDEALWSADGEWLIYRTGTVPGVRDIYARRVRGDTSRVTVAAGRADEYMPALSPDGKWIAYVSVESGREEVFVRPFPNTAQGRTQVSIAGGAHPVWSASGRELYYVERADTLVAVGTGGTTEFQPTGRRSLFSTRAFVLFPYHQAFTALPGDQGFIFLSRAEVPIDAARQLVVVHWGRRGQGQDGGRPVSAVPERLTRAFADRYRVERQLGEGGMATVYLAHDLRHDRQVAVKVLREELAAVIGAERFLAEIKTTANLQHPHILPLFDSGQVDGTVFYVMPYIEGESLRDRLERETQLPVEEAVRIAREVAHALDYAHRRGIIHRDIKPDNILLHDGSASWPTSASRSPPRRRAAPG
ncbi:MAG: protein kinase [Gemmatimonadetes bacterium]|nr:protein kinase [Gemmatimonadota bacterium]